MSRLTNLINRLLGRSSAPVFVIKGNDQLAIATICTWIDLAEHTGVNKEKLKLAEEALAQFQLYQRTHSHFCHIPD
jgi:hypothetical protein